MSGATTVVRRRVEWVDTDAAGIHHHTAIARFAEAAEAEHMRVRGLDDYFPAAPRVRYEVDFEAPLLFGQEVTTTLAVERVGTSSMTFVFEVWGEAYGDRERVRSAVGRYVTVHVSGPHDPGSGSTPWPEGWAQRVTDPAPA